MIFVNTLWLTLMELAPWLFLGSIISALMHKLLPSGLIAKELTGKLGVFKSVALGIPLPLCSCGVIPAGISLKKDGASDSSAIGFLISTPQTGVDSILVSAAFLGWPFAIFKMLSAGLTGIIGGLFIEYLKEDSKPLEHVHVHEQDSKPSPTWSDSVEHGVQLLRGIWRWIVVGVILSAIIQTLIPTDWLANLSGLWAPIFALAISVPLYVCTTGSVPIAASLVAGGFPTGAALVFLMAGPATNVATIGAVRKTFGSTNTVIYLMTVILGSLVLGITFDFIITPNTTTHVHEHGGSLIEAISAVVLILSFLFFAYEELKILRKSRSKDTSNVEVLISGMTCNNCVSKLNRHLSKHPSVQDVHVTLEPPKAYLNTNLSKTEVLDLIHEAGFKTSSV